MKKTSVIILGVIVITGAAVALWVFVFNGGIYTPPEQSADHRFGFLGRPDPGDMKEIRELGAGWVRPHPGPFIWGEMQESANDGYDFSKTDSMVKNAQKYELNILATIWPYAVWDQMNRPNSQYCKVSGNEFKKEFGEYRCNPYDWKEYLGWVAMVVERYDGNGAGDMPGLITPITHWEVFNEPDLQGGLRGDYNFM